jgi:hypothetical protein
MFVLFVSQDKVYCVVDPAKVSRELIAVPWSSVESISSVRLIRQKDVRD